MGKVKKHSVFVGSRSKITRIITISYYIAMYLYSDNINFLAVDGRCGMATLSLCDGAFPHDVLRTAHLIEV